MGSENVTIRIYVEERPNTRNRRVGLQGRARLGPARGWGWRLPPPPESSPIQALELGCGDWNGGYLSPSLSRILRAGAASCQGNMERQQVTTLSEDGLDSGFLPAVCGQDSCFRASRSQDSWAVLSWAALGALSCWRETLPVVRQTRALTCMSVIHFHFLGHAIPAASNVEGEVSPR